MAKETGKIHSTGGSARRNVKDTVFWDLFSIPKYQLQLYQVLHPEDDTVTEADLSEATIETVLSAGIYNDLGFTVRSRLLLMVEAQSDWSVNILVRVLLYLAETWFDHIKSTDQKMYGRKRLSIPRPEFYVVYTGDKINCPEYLSLSDVFFDGEDSDLNLRIRVLRGDGSGNILDQYIAFTKICDEQYRKIGRCSEAIREAVRICIERDILKEYLKMREGEVVNIIMSLFDQEYITEQYVQEREEIAVERGMEQGMAQGMELMKSVLRDHAAGKSVSEIAADRDLTEEEVEQMIS